MTEASTTIKSTNKSTEVQVVRETVESLAVAFILALLFKAFIAEAFVIPTGSMAPTLMGAHKDVRCEECGYQYQCGASNEFDGVGARTEALVIGTTCPLCRKPQIANPAKNANLATFSGDRILVSKLAYAWTQPRRWDVIVFKFIEKAHQNYIKRCTGRPNETLRIREGNIYVRDDSVVPKGSVDDAKADGSAFKIARKPPHVINAMLQLLSDSNYLPKKLIKAGLPSSWQPFPIEESNWQVEQTELKWSASISKVPSGKTHWLRYYHRVVDTLAWEYVEETGKLPAPVLPNSSRLVSDFTAYNAGYSANQSQINIEKFDLIARDSIRNSNRNGFGPRPLENDGVHWTGDLAGEFEITTDRDTASLALMLVESGVEHECRIDLKTGQCTLAVLVEGKPVNAFLGENDTLADKATATSSIRAGGKHRVRFANVDDTLVLWVDGTPVKWSPSGNLKSEAYLAFGSSVPKSTPSNPLDAAPIAIGIEGGGAQIHRARAFRDIYYIASIGSMLFDYTDVLNSLRQTSTPENNERYAREVHNMSYNELSQKMSQEGIYRNAILSNPNLWACGPMAKSRQNVMFSLQKDEYFPMGDNSAASSDARSWREHHQPKRLFIGRAVMVFWPHYWNAPVPFLPNVQRMGLIR